ncbi:hypothetical protein BDFB_010757 [Asbolus verrucosus]|uniref:Uncharacterized protein n=1 Tax=Asbolus verrucosus TaxID=1661398 RepID=A0A482VTQ7_ASBVE|nr:hypothetical protein BDFB_010757 [Asbolus verrucosus]
MFDTSESSDIEESAVLTVESLLPAKSKEKYENAYRQFDDWCKEKPHKNSTLWRIYSMLRILSVKKNIDIKKFVGLIEHLQFQ